MIIKQITDIIERFAPLEWQESYDNAGLIVGRPDDEVHKALLAVDVTEEVLDEAEAEGCDLVITHHPIVFRALKRFNSADPVERCVERAIRSRIALYACHTNLDSAPGGMSWRLAEMLGVGNLRVLLPEAIDTVEFMRIIQRRLEVSVVRYSDIATSGVRRVAVCTGAGASLIGEARRAGADIYITADMKYNDFMAPDKALTVADIGHFESEYCAIQLRDRIMALYELQKIDSKIDEINKVKGELPLEVQDLEDEMAGMKTRIEHINAEIEELNTLTKQRKREVDQAKIMIGNYKEQQNNVRNNREFDAITKEIEYQELEIELAEKRLKEYSAGVKAKKLQLEEAENLSVERAADLAAKKAELEGIEAETAPLVAEYAAQGERVKEKIDERLLAAYDRIRRNVRNGLAVVTVKRDACGGCFNRIPPQRQVDIRQGKKIIICEYCGRILVADPDETQE